MALPLSSDNHKVDLAETARSHPGDSCRPAPRLQGGIGEQSVGLPDIGHTDQTDLAACDPLAIGAWLRTPDGGNRGWSHGGDPVAHPALWDGWRVDFERPVAERFAAELSR